MESLNYILILALLVVAGATILFLIYQSLKGRAKQYAQERDEKIALLEARNAELNFLFTIHEGLSGNLELADLIDNALNMLQETLGTEAAGVSIYEPQDNTLVLHSSYGLPEAFSAKVRRLAPGQGTAGTAFVTGAPALLDFQTSRDSELHHHMTDAGFHHHASIPILAGGKSLGVLSVARKNPRPFENNDIHLLESAASILGSAIKAAALHNETVMELEQRTLVENELEMFFNTALDLLCIMDMNGRFKKLSSRWTQVLGWTTEELQNMTVEQRVFKEDIEATQKEIAALRQGRSVVGFVNRYLTWDGNVRWLEWNSYGNAELGIIIAAARDITDRKRDEDALLEATRVIEEKNQDLTLMMEQLKQAAITDSLTGLYNRRYIMERIHEQAHRFHRNQMPFAFIMGDIDRFKQFNDAHGHDYGDFVLIEVSRLLQRVCRESDVISRWGGEEFLVLLPETDLPEACVIAQRIRSTLEASEYQHAGISCHVTMTFGVEIYQPDLGIDASIQLADRLLLQGKENGRNRVECGSVSTPPKAV